MVAEGPLCETDLDDVGVQRALHEKVHAFPGPGDLLGLFLEHGDELAADELALLLGLGDARELAEETGRSRRRRAGPP